MPSSLRIENQKIAVLEVKGIIVNTSILNQEVGLSIRLADERIIQIQLTESNPHNRVLKIGSEVSVFFLGEIANDRILYLFNNSLQLSKQYFSSERIKTLFNLTKSLESLSLQLSNYIQSEITHKYL